MTTINNRIEAGRRERRVLTRVTRAAWRLEQAERERAWALVSARAEGIAAAREYRSLGAKVTLVVHEMKRLGRGALELLKVAEELRCAEIELEFLTGPLADKHDPAGHGAALFAFFAAMARVRTRLHPRQDP